MAVLDGEMVSGILSEKNIVYKCVAKRLDVDTTLVAAVMTADPVTVDADDTVAHAIEKMTSWQFHHLPVLDNGSLIRMIESDDLSAEYCMLLEHFNKLRN